MQACPQVEYDQRSNIGTILVSLVLLVFSAFPFAARAQTNPVGQVVLISSEISEEAIVKPSIASFSESVRNHGLIVTSVRVGRGQRIVTELQNKVSSELPIVGIVFQGHGIPGSVQIGKWFVSGEGFARNVNEGLQSKNVASTVFVYFACCDGATPCDTTESTQREFIKTFRPDEAQRTVISLAHPERATQPYGAWRLSRPNILFRILAGNPERRPNWPLRVGRKYFSSPFLETGNRAIVDGVAGRTPHSIARGAASSCWTQYTEWRFPVGWKGRRRRNPGRLLA
jgi:hypothetical protein